MYDVAIVGAGLTGCATARALLERDPDCSVAILEKEYHLGRHQSGRNSGVLQPGYASDLSDRESRFRTVGTERAAEFCRRNGVPIREDGATMVAISDREVAVLDDVAESAADAGVEVDRLDATEIRDHEPNAAGVAGLYVPDEAVVDSNHFLSELARQCAAKGATFHMGLEVERIDAAGASIKLRTSSGDVFARTVVNAAGLHAGRLANQLGLARDVTVVPFRCTYYELVPSHADRCRSLLYPTPDPSVSSPGVKFVRRPDGKVVLGPTVSPALGYESYDSAFASHRLRRLASNSGFWRFLASRNTIRMAKRELAKTYRTASFLDEARRILPGLDADELTTSFVGVALRLVTDEGELASSKLDVRTSRRTVNVLNPMSAGVTVSLPLGEHLAEMTLDRL